MVTGFDAVTSLLSRSLQFDYTNFLWVSFVIYVAVGFWGALHQGFVYGTLLGGIAGLSDSTIGWFVSQVIGPFIQPKLPSPNLIVIGLTIVFVTLVALAFASIGALVCKLTGRTRSADT